MNFNTIGIICEYNPFHFGHKYHIEKSKEITGAKNVVCVMSGSMVQRGDVAIFDKWERAKKAVDNGADLVVELPANYVLQSAENFAFGAVSVLDALNVVDAISFGAETDDIHLLEKIADETLSPSDEYILKLKEELSEGKGYPSASEYALRSVFENLPDEVFSPNNTLGISYISALKKLDSSIKPVCIKRGNDYHSALSDDEYKSASAIRKMIMSGEDYSSFAPDYRGCNIYDIKNAESYILGTLRTMKPESLKDIKGYEDGLSNMIITNAKNSSTLNEFFEKCISKRYTLHRIRRFCICAILGIKDDPEIKYVRILGFNEKGASLIKKIKEKSSLIPVTKTADYNGDELFEKDILSTDFASLCSSDVKKRICGADFVKSPYVKK